MRLSDATVPWGCLDDVSMLATRRGGACFVVASEDVGVLMVQGLVYSFKGHIG